MNSSFASTSSHSAHSKNTAPLSTSLPRKPPVPTINRAPSTQRAPFGTSQAQNSANPTIIGNGLGAQMKTQMRSQLNQTNGNFTNKLPNSQNSNVQKVGIQTNITLGMKPGSAQRVNLVPPKVTQGTVVHHQLETEISVIYSLFNKTQELVASAKDGKEHAKILTSFDVEKWKKKFFLVFTREKGTLDLSVNPQQILDLKNMTLDPQATSRVGMRILKSNAKFWVIYLNIVAEKLNDFAKSMLRARLFGNPDQQVTGAFSGPDQKADFDFLLKKIGSIIDADKLFHQTDATDPSVPTFGGFQPIQNDSENLQSKETFTLDENPVPQLLIESPPDDYLTDGIALQKSLLRQRDTPQFQNDEDSQEEGEEVEYHECNDEQFDHEDQPQINKKQKTEDIHQEEQHNQHDVPNEEIQKPDQTFYTCIMGPPLQENDEGEVQQENVTFYQEANCEEQNPIQTEDFNTLANQAQINEDKQAQEIHQEQPEFQQIKEEQDVIQFEIQVDSLQQNEEELQIIEGIPEPTTESCQVQEALSVVQEEEVSQKPQVYERPTEKIIEETKEEARNEEIIEVKENVSVIVEQDNPELQAFMEAKYKNPKKRKLSPSVKSGTSQITMTLRSRAKRRKENPDSDIDDCVSQIGGEVPMGSSYIRYEIIEKKGKQYLVPVRYSIRRIATGQQQAQINKAIEDHEMEIERQIIKQEIDFEYKPSEMEGSFQMTQSAQEIRKILLSSNGKREFEKLRVNVSDIQEIVLVSEGGDYALIKLRKDCREKFSNHAYVGVSLARISTSRRGRTKQQASELQMMEHLLKNKKRIRTGVMFTEAAPDTIEHIKNTYSVRVTRAAAAAQAHK